MSLKNRSQFSSTLDNDLKIKLKELSVETKVPISKLLDEALELLLEKRYPFYKHMSDEEVEDK